MCRCYWRGTVKWVVTVHVAWQLNWRDRHQVALGNLYSSDGLGHNNSADAWKRQNRQHLTEKVIFYTTTFLVVRDIVASIARTWNVSKRQMQNVKNSLRPRPNLCKMDLVSCDIINGFCSSLPLTTRAKFVHWKVELD